MIHRWTPFLLLALLALVAAPAADPARADDAGGEAPPAAAKAPDFTLRDIDGTEHKLSQYAGQWVVLEWVNYRCPFVVKHYHETHRNMQRLQAKLTNKDVVWLSVCSSAEGKQGWMEPADWKRSIQELGVKASAILLDVSGEVGHAYGARTTPEIRIIDPQGHVRYEGAIDDKRSTSPQDVQRSKNYVETFFDAVLAGQTPDVPARTEPYGCTVKYATP
jgi:peroxiredoxin